MSPERAIEIIQKDGWGYPETEREEAVDMAVEALRKQIPQKPSDIIPLIKSPRKGYCPECDKMKTDREKGIRYSVASLVTDEYFYCPVCGQRLDWTEEEE